MKRYLLFIALTLCLNATAQWNKLPGFGMPVENGHILYTTYVYLSPSSGQTMEIYESRDDLYNYHRKYQTSGPGFLAGGFACKKDSSVIFYDGFYGVASLEFTKDDFAHYSVISYCTTNSSNTHYNSYDLTNSYIYVTSQPSSTDSLIISRTSTTTLSQTTCRKYYKYSGLYGGIRFVSDSVGHVLTSYRSNSAKKTLLRTTNYGNTWTEVYIDSVINIKSFHFPSENTGYILRNNGTILKTLDGGNTWVTLNIPITNQINCLKFSTDSIGYIGGSSGSLFRTIDGGNTWSAEISGTTAGIYSLFAFKNDVVYFTDSIAGLYKNKSLLPPEQPVYYPPIINITQSLSSACLGTAVTFTASGANSYSWSSNAGGANTAAITIYPQISATYTVTGTNGPYTDTQTVSINIIQPPIPTITSSIPSPICKGDAVTLTASGANSYIWYFTTTGVASASITESPIADTSYTVKGTNSQGCYGYKTIDIKVKECDNYSGDLVIYPSPGSTTIVIQSTSTEIESISVNNCIGEIIFSSITKSHQFTMDVAALAEGIYYAIIVTNQGKFNKKIFVKH